MSEGERSPWSDAVQNWLVCIGSGALFPQLDLDLSPGIRFLLGAVTVVCFAATWQRLRELVQNLGRTLAGLLKHWPLLLVLVIGVLIGLILSHYQGLPRDVLKVRHEMVGILSALEKAEPRTVARLDGTGNETWYVEGFKVIMIEPSIGPGKIIKIYIKDGQRIAEDLRGNAPETIERRYYRATCNFATDHFYGTGYAYLEYNDGCRNGPSRLFESETPVLPVPMLSYR